MSKHNTDDEPTWEELALFCQRNKHRLNLNAHDFVDKMAAGAVLGHGLSPKQCDYLFALFLKLGGRIT